MRLVEEQKSARRAQIIDSASRLIEKGGVEGLTMARVAEGARVTVPTVYNLVGNRDAVVAAVMDAARDRFLDTLRASGAEAAARDAGERTSDAEQVIAVVEAFVTELSDRARLYQPIVQIGLRSDVDRGEAIRDVLEPRLQSAVATMHARGALADWVAPGFAAERLCALVLNAGWTWSLERIGTDSLRRCVLHDVAAYLAGVCVGETRVRFERIAASHQPGDRARSGS